MSDKNQETANRQDLLEYVCGLLKDQQQRKRLGKSINVWKILALQWAEEKGHSRFLSWLLNPNETHAQGDVFLKIFLGLIEQDVGSNAFYVVPDDRVSVSTEYDISSTSSGRIDIWIQTSRWAVAIENKVNADDMEGQLFRYYQHAEKCFSDNFKVVYLTLSGNSATEKSTKGLGSKREQIVEISYENDILFFLDECIKRSSNIGPLMLLLKNYKQTVRSICGMGEDSVLTEQIVKQISSSHEYLQSAVEIGAAVKNFGQRRKDDFFSLIDSLSHENANLRRIELESGPNRREFRGFSFEEAKFSFVVCHENSGIWVGFYLMNGSMLDDQLVERFKNRISSCLDPEVLKHAGGRSKKFPIWSWFEEEGIKVDFSSFEPKGIWEQSEFSRQSKKFIEKHVIQVVEKLLINPDQMIRHERSRDVDSKPK